MSNDPLDNLGARSLDATDALAWATNGAKTVACILTLLMSFGFGYEVIARYFFKSPTGVVNQFAAYMMPLITFLGAAWTLRTDGHVSVDIFTARLPIAKETVLRLVMESLSAALVGFLAVLAGATVFESYEQGTRSFATAVTFPEFIPQLIMPAGLSLLFLEQIRLCRLSWRQLQEGRRKPATESPRAYIDRGRK